MIQRKAFHNKELSCTNIKSADVEKPWTEGSEMVWVACPIIEAAWITEDSTAWLPESQCSSPACTNVRKTSGAHCYIVLLYFLVQIKFTQWAPPCLLPCRLLSLSAWQWAAGETIRPLSHPRDLPSVLLFTICQWHRIQGRILKSDWDNESGVLKLRSLDPQEVSGCWNLRGGDNGLLKNLSFAGTR